MIKRKYQNAEIRFKKIWKTCNFFLDLKKKCNEMNSSATFFFHSNLTLQGSLMFQPFFFPLNAKSKEIMMNDINEKG